MTNFIVELNEEDVNILFNNLTLTKESQVLMKKILDARMSQKSKSDWDDVPDTPWNNYLYIVNQGILALDSDKIAIHKYIEKCWKEMMELGFDPKLISMWYKSQMQITGNGYLADLHDFDMLYPTKLDMDKLLETFKDSVKK